MPRVKEDYYENKRKEIIDAAYRVCSRKPITSVEMKDVIAETGFSHGVIYRYYKDLDEVICDLVVRINSENRLDVKLNEILKGDERDWRNVIRRICDMMAEHMMAAGTDVLKISLYSDMLAMSDPERVNRISKAIGDDNQSPLLSVVRVMVEFLTGLVREKGLKPSKSIEEIIEFMIVNYHGVQTGYVLSKCVEAEHVQGKYDPGAMFSCLADSMILMMGGNVI
ncbi:MAG: TetR/AcrR family transcriptional regulator [Lachnospiraceae bacterium]|nr:TetR/AcrR family transcriptional regulator [Lachnospiraceae bacterium]